MPDEERRTAAPKLRFPEFRNDGAWTATPLSDLCDRIVEKVGDTVLTPVSITAGRGFVSQTEKFGRDIAGAQYKNYIHLRRGDFAYNKGNSNLYPQGCVYRLKEFDEAAASNAFICFQLKEGNAAGFFEGLFEKNTHGRQLIRFLTSGARSDGLLNIKPDEFFSVEFPVPPRSAEQQKIADCLTSLNELIAAQGRKVEALKAHKKGLMQQLFPREGETFPRLRLPEFHDAPEWEERPLEACFSHIRNGFVGTATPYYVEGGVPYLQGKNVKKGQIDPTGLVTISEAFHAKQKKSQLRSDDIVMVQSGHVGECALVGDAYAGANCHALIIMSPKDRQHSPFFVHCFGSDYGVNLIAQITTGNTIKHILASDMKAMIVRSPEYDEQQRIADCLSSLDAQITAATQKLDALKIHKQGLLQQLFPSPEEAS